MRKIIKKLLPINIINKYRAYREEKIRIQFDEEIKGDDVYCPICESSFKYFGEFGLRKRANALCFSCGSLERHRLLYLFLKNKINLFQDKGEIIRLLHFAPEQVFFGIFTKSRNFEYYPCDLFPEKYNYDNFTQVLKVDITNIPFDDNSFDFILCNHVLEHIPDDLQAMKELFRVMSKTGSGIFQVPIDYSRSVTYEDWNITTPEDREIAFGQNDHVRWYGKDYKNRLEKAGFKVEEIDYISKFSINEVYKYGLDSNEKIYLCKKN